MGLQLTPLYLGLPWTYFEVGGDGGGEGGAFVGVVIGKGCVGCWLGNNRLHDHHLKS